MIPVKNMCTHSKGGVYQPNLSLFRSEKNSVRSQKQRISFKMLFQWMLKLFVIVTTFPMKFWCHNRRQWKNTNWTTRSTKCHYYIMTAEKHSTDSWCKLSTGLPSSSPLTAKFTLDHIERSFISSSPWPNIFYINIHKSVFKLTLVYYPKFHDYCRIWKPRLITHYGNNREQFCKESFTFSIQQGPVNNSNFHTQMTLIRSFSLVSKKAQPG